MSATQGLQPLIKIGWRSIRKSPLRSLLIFGLIAVVVATGTFAAIVNRSTSVNSADAQQSEFGSGNFRADFGTSQYGSRGLAFGGPDGLPIALPPPEAVGGDYQVFQQEEFETQRQADEAWLDQFDLADTKTAIEAALGVDVSLERRAQVGTTQGPFGSRGPAIGTISDLDLTHPAAEGALLLLEGRLPTAPTEIAIQHQDRDGQPEIGDDITINTEVLTVVGVVTDPASRWWSATLVTGEMFDRLASSESGTSFIVRADLAGGDAVAPQAATALSSIVDRSISVRTPSSVFVPQANEWVSYPRVEEDGQVGAAVPPIWPILITALLATQIALVCAAAFAVGIRRRTKEFGQLMTLGADDRHIRRLAQVEAALLGILAAVLGLVVGVVVATWLLSNGILDTIGNRVPTGVRWSIIDWVGPAAVGIAAVIAAAWWPTRVLANAPIPGVLEGRLPSVAVRKTTPRLGLALVAAGTAFLAGGSQIMTNGDSSGSGAAFALVAFGIIAMIGGSLLLIGTVLSILGQRADRFPLLTRLVVRNSDRQRSRSWVVVGAFIAVLAMPVVIGASIKAYPDSYQSQQTSEFEARLLTTSHVDPDYGPGQIATDQALVDFDNDFGRAISEVRPVRGAAGLFHAPLAQIVWVQERGSFYGGGRLLSATPALVDLLDLDKALVDALADGKVVDVSTINQGWATGEPRFINEGVQRDVGSAIEVVTGPGVFGQTWLMSPTALAERGVTTVETGTIRLLEEPLTVVQEDAIRQIGNSMWIERFGQFNYGPPSEDSIVSGWVNMDVNRRHHAGASASTVRFWSSIAAIGLGLLVAFVTASLSAVEMTPEIESMIATGASPSIRRKLLGAQTYYHLLVAALMAVPLAVLAFWAASRADTYGRPTGLTIPWTSVAITAGLVPLIVAIVVTATFRNGKPAVSRRLS